MIDWDSGSTYKTGDVISYRGQAHIIKATSAGQLNLFSLTDGNLIPLEKPSMLDKVKKFKSLCPPEQK